MVTFLVVFIASYYLHGLGVTVGYHRLLSHKTFKCAKLAEYFWVFWGYLAFEGSPAWWATVHRVHHKFADHEKDPHSPRHGNKHSYFSWMFRQDLELINVPKVCPDLMRDPVYKLLERGDDPLMLVLNILFRVLLWWIFGWQIALANFLAGVFVLQIPLMLNFACHKPNLGYKNYQLDNDATNVWWVALLSAGEGWHNNHHASPYSAKTGERWFEFDLSWLVIRLMQKLGLVTHVTVAKKEADTSPSKPTMIRA